MNELATAGQTALFFADQKEAVGVYNTVTVLTMSGPVDRKQVVDGCRRLVRATPALRLRTGLDGWTGDVVQWLSDDEPEIHWHEAAEWSAPVDHGLAAPFDTDGGALVRFVGVRVDERRTVLALVSHHLTIDGPCHVRLGRRLGQTMVGPVDVQPEAAYVDLVRHTRLVEERARRDERSYWDTRLPAGTVLRGWRTTPADRGGADAGCEMFELDDPTRNRIAVAADGVGATFFQFLTAVVHSVAPVTGDGVSSVCAATSIRPRDHSRDDVFGYFINEIPLTADRPGSAVESARRSADRWRSDLRTRNFPFIDLANRTGSTGTPALRLDSVMIAYRHAPRYITWADGGVDFELDLYPRFLDAKTELCVRFYERGAALECEVQWGRNLPGGLGAPFRRDVEAALRAV